MRRGVARIVRRAGRDRWSIRASLEKVPEIWARTDYTSRLHDLDPYLYPGFLIPLFPFRHPSFITPSSSRHRTRAQYDTAIQGFFLGRSGVLLDTKAIKYTQPHMVIDVFSSYTVVIFQFRVGDWRASVFSPDIDIVQQCNF
ncbi:hypothetical protein BCR34DRAFT_135801 [Clohesyomyces aquaticus]|uniref:Uncharacterized protein n=1 Tax=Clohesyomyces aquaticus TaxID=1231657 RepID=A0A1Y2ABD9_9PLEO|nr:hypothetical protein BCR34DRAFT_135801 [Clohesyomyces aquaticus]